MSGNLFLLTILLLTTLIVYVHRRYQKIQAIPLILLLYISFMFLGNLHLWDHKDPTITAIQNQTINNLLPAMIFLMMLGFNLKLFKELGSKMLWAFFATTASLILAFVSIFYLFKPFLWEDAQQSFATLAGSWSGGTINMVAVGKVIGISESAMAHVVVVDTIAYSLWVMFLLLLVPFANKFNSFTKADIHNITVDISCCINSDLISYVRIIFIAVAVALSVNLLSFMLPKVSFLSPTFYAVVLATLLGLIASKSKLSLLPSQSVANSMLYLIIALIASKASISDLSTTFHFLGLALGILLLHALMMIGFAKLFKLDLFSVAVASLAHIGGTAGATVLASSYHKSLIPIAVVMATGGYLLGTFVGLLIAFLLQL